MLYFRSMKFCLTCLVLVALGTGSCTRQPPRPNIVVIVVDALRKDHLGAYGYKRNTSPRIDAFAAENYLFQSATSNCPWTSPSVATLFTGLYPSVHGTVEHYGNTASNIDENLVTVAQVLRQSGYLTAGFVANSWLDPGLGFDRGFDLFDQINVKPKPRAAEVNAKVLGWLDMAQDGPFFLYIHYMDLHGPYRPPAPFDQAFKAETSRKLGLSERKKLDYLEVDFALDGNDLNYYRDQYDGEILYTDGYIGQVIETLKERGLLAETVVVITSDHGEAFLEHGQWEHGKSVYEEEIAVPLVMSFPTWMEAGHQPPIARSAAAPVELVDLAPTLLGLAGTKFPYPVNGRDMLASGPEDPETRLRFSEELAPHFKGPPKLAWRRADLKAICDPRTGQMTEMFDLDRDPGETVNLIDEPSLADEVIAFEKDIMGHLEASRRMRTEMGISGEAVPLDSALLRKLKSLGYTH